MEKFYLIWLLVIPQTDGSLTFTADYTEILGTKFDCISALIEMDKDHREQDREDGIVRKIYCESFRYELD